MDRLDLTNTIWFLGWLIALAVLFVLGLRLPLQPSLRRLPAFGYVTGIVVSVGVTATELPVTTPTP